MSYFCMSSSQTAPFVNLSLSLSLSPWRWGQRGISCAPQTSLGGETLSTVSAGAEQGSPGNKKTHKLSSPLHPAVSRTKLLTPSRFVQTVTARFLSFGALFGHKNGWKNWVRVALKRSLPVSLYFKAFGKCSLRALTYFNSHQTVRGNEGHGWVHLSHRCFVAK